MDTQPVLVATLPLPPMPQPRPRCTCVQPKTGGICPTCKRPRARPVARAYTGARGTQRDLFTPWRKQIVPLLKRLWPHRPLLGPVRFSATFVVSRPTTRPAPPKHITRMVRGEKTKLVNPRWEAGEVLCTPEHWKSGERIPCGRLPDLDRYVNAVWDALTDAGVWWDDGQVSGFGAISKWWAAQGEDPHIWLRVEAW